MSNCQTTRALLSDHLDAPAGAGAPAPVRAHLESCPDCASYRAELERLDSRLSASRLDTAPAGLHEGIIAAVRQSETAPADGGKVSAFPRWLAPTALAAAAAIVALIVIKGAGDPPAQPPVAGDPAVEEIEIPEPGGLPSGFGVPVDVASITSAVERGLSASLGREADLIVSDVGKVRDFFGERLRRVTGQGS